MCANIDLNIDWKFIKIRIPSLPAIDRQKTISQNSSDRPFPTRLTQFSISFLSEAVLCESTLSSLLRPCLQQSPSVFVKARTRLQKWATCPLAGDWAPLAEQKSRVSVTTLSDRGRIEKTSHPELRETWPLVVPLLMGSDIDCAELAVFLPAHFILTGTLSSVMMYTVSRLCVF